MEIFGPEVNALFLRPFLDDFEVAHGKAEVDAFLAAYGVAREEIDSPTVWITLAFAETLLEDLAKRRHDPAMLERCGRLAFAPKYVGLLGPILKVLGTPKMAYAQLTTGLPRLNKVGRMSVDVIGRGHVVVRYSSIDGAPREQSPVICEVRAANLAGMATMFDVPPARVTQDACVHRGDAECVYDVRYAEPIRRLQSTAGLLLGAVLGAASQGLDWPRWVVVIVTIVCAAAGYALGRRREFGAQVAATLREVFELRDALVRSARAHEDRFAELAEAKVSVERKVEERTHDLREATLALERTVVEVRALDEAKTRFFANVSHDLRTPLTMILGPLEDMLHGRKPFGDTMATVEVMYRNGKRLLRLINQLLDLARLDAGGTKLARSVVDAASLARAAALPFEQAALTREIKLTVEAPLEPTPLFADPGWIDSALSNLLANAMRFAPEHGHVTLRVVDRGHEVVFDVEDDGEGIAPQDRASLFERFVQGSSEAGRTGGTGLGLAIAREAARLHHGEAEVESEPGSGARFRLRVPRRPTAENEAEQHSSHVSRPSIPQPSAALDLPVSAGPVRRDGPSSNAPLALVAEDHDDLRAFVADVLAAHYRVLAVSNGREAMDAALIELPAIVVSDVDMPVMDGLAFVRALRDEPRTRDVPVVLVTAYGDVEHVLASFEAGADDYVAKPFHARELLARVDVRVRLAHLTSELVHKERLAMLGTTAASVAHEVRNPLTSIRVGLPALRAKLADKLSARDQQMLDVMIDGSARIEAITTDLLDLSRIDREIEGRCRPGEGLLSATRLVGARLPIGVTLDVDVDAKLEMSAAAGDLNQVFLNLLDNAARAVGDKGRIRVVARREADAFVVTFDDSGTGIRPEVAANLFEPFVTTRAAGAGTGLGLAIAKRVVERHAGTIAHGTSELGGALFTVNLPVRVSPWCARTEAGEARPEVMASGVR